MVEAFIYMYFVGLGTALGVGTVAFMGWKVVQRSNNKKVKRKGAY
ncbi:hypothetical protein SFC08_16790 [Lysinibacillus halotolerans]